MSSTKRARGTAGFTLAELMIALVLASVFAVIMFKFLTGQARFTMAQDARGEVEQNTRGAMELMVSELRAVPGHAIVSGTATTIQFRVPRLWGVLCAPIAGNAVTMVFPGLGSTSDVFPRDYGATSSWGFALQRDTVNGAVMFATAPVTDTTTTAATTTACTTNLGVNLNAAADSLPPKALTLTTSAAPSIGGSNYAGAIGNLGFLYQTVTYDAGTSSVASGQWLRRSLASAGGSPQPIAGPLQAGNSNALKFTYLCRGAPMASVASDVDRSRITAVRIELAMQSRSRTQSVLQIERDTVTVHLRNSGRVIAC